MISIKETIDRMRVIVAAEDEYEVYLEGCGDGDRIAHVDGIQLFNEGRAQGYVLGVAAGEVIATDFIRTQRQDAYKLGFEHAERLYKSFRPKAITAITEV